MIRKSKEAKIAEEYINKLESIGWFADFPKELKEITENKIKKDKRRRPDLCLPGTIVNLESASCEGVYREIILQLSKNSYNLFNPTLVTEKWVDLPEGILVEVILAVGGKEYAHDWIAKGSYVDENFDYLMREVIERVSPNLTLGTIWLGEQQVLYLVCSKFAYQRGLKQGLFLSSYQDMNFSEEAVNTLLNRFQDKKSTLRTQAAAFLQLWFDFGSFNYECAKAFQAAVKDRDKAVKLVATAFVEKYGEEIEKHKEELQSNNIKRVGFKAQAGYCRYKDQNLFNSRNQIAQEYIERLTEVGWFDGLPKTLKEIIEEEIVDDDYQRPDLCLPGLYEYLDCVDRPGVHKALIEALVERSLKIFNPEHIEEKWNKSGQVSLTIKVNGNKYSSSWKQEDQVIDTNFENLLKEAIQASNPNLTLGTIWPGDDGKLFLVCNKTAYQKALEKGLFLTVDNNKLSLTPEGVDNLKSIFSNPKSALRLFSAELLALWLQTGEYKEADLDVFRDAFEDPNENIRKIAKKLMIRFGKVYTIN